MITFEGLSQETESWPREHSPSDSLAAHDKASPIRTRGAPGNHPTLALLPSAATASPPQTSRFIGHLNPEARLVARTRHNSPEPDRERDHLGVWFRDPVPHDIAAEPLPVAANSLQRYVNVIRKFEIPEGTVCTALSNIYFSTIHQFLPMIDEAAFRRRLDDGTLSVSLLLAVLLVVCRDSRAKPHLWFPSQGGGSRIRPLQTREFAQRVYSHLASLLKAEVETDKATLIQVHALMSLHCEGPSGNETASLNLFTAIHYLQVLGMHLPRADETDKSGRCAVIFWSVWSLDRLNAAQYGRPTIIHERDMANKAAFSRTEAAKKKTFAAFIVWLELTVLLDRTISYYRPVAEPTCTGWEEGFPSFEEILSGNDRNIPTQLLYVLEIYYHAIAILTSRFREWNPVTASNASSMRQALSTMHMLQMAQEIQLADLAALPVIPYAMTLCMTVAYRQCRECLSLVIGRATKHLVSACTALEDLAGKWWMAEAMAKLGRQAIGRVEEHRDQQPTPVQMQSQQAQSQQRPAVSVHIPQPAGEATSTESAPNSVADGTLAARNNNSDEVLVSAADVPENLLGPTTAAPPSDSFCSGGEWVPQLDPMDSGHNIQSDPFYDYFLLDSIPNLVYPEAGLRDGLFDEVRLFDGFGTVM
ncbi:hypothetical protein SBRCBS47491_009445 [Sporothrix bragantina]|uniref:Xylanolytic transcriptional activator regulatory domain-containing protein n=1 Tax=Sporothrix bragantina TaxID=671064 RepID=A0ABP0CUS1_9PEZI